VLAVDVIQAAKAGANLIVTNSSLDLTDKLVAALAMDPLRGTASVLWNAVTQALVADGYFKRDELSRIAGADRFLADRTYGLADAESVTGVSQADIRKAAELLKGAKRVVFIHSPDRLQDSSPGGMRTLANLVVLLRSVGVAAEILLPRITANSAALEPLGADPGFLPGRVASSEKLAGARTHAELRKLLEDGELRAALILGEDPMAWNQTGSWFQNVEFLAAMDWTPTETTAYADVVLPGSTYLEQGGTRCNFEGNMVQFTEAVPPASEMSGIRVLCALATEFGIKVPGELSAHIEHVVRDSLGRLASFYMNRGGEPRAEAKASLVAAGAEAKPMRVQPPLTPGEKYKRELREVGTERFRVR
ncbi:MAG TPA: molybdopterin-dependent oxidoreductase, partial [bacterium]|nr:molybdopterin-dependent oxidoreductase [bacterium]